MKNTTTTTTTTTTPTASIDAPQAYAIDVSTQAEALQVFDSSLQPWKVLSELSGFSYIYHHKKHVEASKWGAHIRPRVVPRENEQVSANSQIVLTIYDRFATNGLTFTFLDSGYPKVEFGDAYGFYEMTRRLFQKLRVIKSVYQARAEYIEATGASWDDVPDVKGRSPHTFEWFSGDTLPPLDDTTSYYSASKLRAMAKTYKKWAADGV